MKNVNLIGRKVIVSQNGKNFFGRITDKMGKIVGLQSYKIKIDDTGRILTNMVPGRNMNTWKIVKVL